MCESSLRLIAGLKIRSISKNNILEKNVDHSHRALIEQRSGMDNIHKSPTNWQKNRQTNLLITLHPTQPHVKRLLICSLRFNLTCDNDGLQFIRQRRTKVGRTRRGQCSQHNGRRSYMLIKCVLYSFEENHKIIHEFL